MEIGEILKKMGRATLTNAEQEALRLWGNSVQSNNATVGDIVSGVYSPTFKNINCEMLFHQVSPVYGTVYAKSDFEIANTTWTTLTVISGAEPGAKTFTYVDVSAIGTIKIRPTYQVPTRNIMISGFVQWASNATGIRRIRIKLTVPSTATDYYYYVSDVPAVNGDVTGQSYNFMRGIDTSTPITFQVQVYQSSGGNLNVELSGFTALLIL